MLHQDIMVAMDFFAASNSYDFLNQYCPNLLKNPTVRGLRILVGSLQKFLFKNKNSRSC